MIKTDYLKNKEEDMNDDYEKLDAAQQTVRDIINNVADISSATAPSTASIDTAKNNAVDSLIELEEDLNSFTSEGEDQNSDIETLLNNIEITINDAGAVSGSGRFMDYTGTSMTLGLPVLKAYNAEKRDEMIKKAEKAKDTAIKNMDEPSQEILNKLYNQLENGEIDEAEFYSQLDNLTDLQREETTFKDLQQKDKEQLMEENGSFVSALQTVAGQDWYARFTDASSLSAFITNFSKRFDDIEKNNPKAAAALLKALNQSDELTNFLNKTEDLTRKLKSNPTVAKYLAEFGKANTWLGALKDVGSNKYLKAGIDALRSGVDMVKDSKFGSAVISALDSKNVKTFGSKAKGLLNKVGKIGPVATIGSIGLNGYYNFRHEEVLGDYSEGQRVRGSAKALAGTVIDTVENIGPIDGLIGGAMAGGLPGAIAGGAFGAGNKIAQFFWPSGYEKIKTLAFQGIDWAADGLNKVKEDIGNGIQAGINSIKSGVSDWFKSKLVFN